MIIDTHTHLYLDDFDDPNAAVERALAAGVGHMILPNVDLTTYDAMMKLHAAYPDSTSVAVGLHPTEIKDTWRDDLASTMRLIDTTADIVAIGEIGIDLYWDSTYRKEQMEAFRQQSLKALDMDLPIIIHCREGLDEVIEVMKGLPSQPRAVMHSFTGNAADIERLREVVPDIYFGINGIVTFKKSSLPEILPAIGLDRLLLETDSPYLAPVPYRGRRNESAYIVNTADFVASSLGIDRAVIDAATTRNARNLFGLR